MSISLLLLGFPRRQVCLELGYLRLAASGVLLLAGGANRFALGTCCVVLEWHARLQNFLFSCIFWQQNILYFFKVLVSLFLNVKELFLLALLGLIFRFRWLGGLLDWCLLFSLSYASLLGLWWRLRLLQLKMLVNGVNFLVSVHASVRIERLLILQ